MTCHSFFFIRVGISEGGPRNFTREAEERLQRSRSHLQPRWCLIQQGGAPAVHRDHRGRDGRSCVHEPRACAHSLTAAGFIPCSFRSLRGVFCTTPAPSYIRRGTLRIPLLAKEGPGVVTAPSPQTEVPQAFPERSCSGSTPDPTRYERRCPARPQPLPPSSLPTQ